MVASGMPRMASRVFALLLSRDDGSATSAELAAALQASPAAISGAVRYLIQLHLITKAHGPGAARRLPAAVRSLVRDGREPRSRAAAMGQAESGRSRCGGVDTRAGARLEETARFFEFLINEMPSVLERWRSEARDG